MNGWNDDDPQLLETQRGTKYAVHSWWSTGLSENKTMKRREFIRTAGGVAGGAAAATAPTTAQQSSNTTAGNDSAEGNITAGDKSSNVTGGNATGPGGGMTTYKLGGKVAGWEGQAPPSIQGTTNPPLVFKPGQKYKVVWENLDGVSHDFAVNDSDGNTITKTDVMSAQGETLSLTFTATNKMAEYICTIHPSTMKGNVQQSAASSGSGGGEKQQNPEEMGVPFQAHFVGIATVLMTVVSLVFTFFTLKYGESLNAKGGNN